MCYFGSAPICLAVLRWVKEFLRIVLDTCQGLLVKDFPKQLYKGTGGLTAAKSVNHTRVMDSETNYMNRIGKNISMYCSYETSIYISILCNFEPQRLFGNVHGSIIKTSEISSWCDCWIPLAGLVMRKEFRFHDVIMRWEKQSIVSWWELFDEQKYTLDISRSLFPQNSWALSDRDIPGIHGITTRVLYIPTNQIILRRGDHLFTTGHPAYISDIHVLQTGSIS